MNRFIGLIALCFAAVITLGTISGCPKKDTKKDTATSKETSTVETKKDETTTTKKEEVTTTKKDEVMTKKDDTTTKKDDTTTKKDDKKTETKNGTKKDGASLNVNRDAVAFADGIVVDAVSVRQYTL